VPGIHVLAAYRRRKGVDGRDKPGHDEVVTKRRDVVIPEAANGPRKMHSRYLSWVIEENL
jgi:hypothetical protein